MKAKEIRDLIDFIAKSGLDEVNIETEEFKINVKKQGAPVVQAAPVAQQVPVVQAAAPAPAPAAAPAEPAPTAAAPTPAPQPAAEESTGVAITSPMIGTFYRSPDPESPVFVEIGDKVKKGQTVCIVEAMKLFNEIESEVDGTIVKVLVDNSSPVEYGQKLFLVQPD